MPDWQIVNMVILYSLLGNTSGDEAMVRSLAKRAIEHPDAYLTTEEFYAGIAEMLRSDAVLTGSLQGLLPSEHEYRVFLGHLLDRLDGMRPWPEPPFHVVNETLWHDWGSMRVAGRIRLSLLRLMQRLQHVFLHLTDEPRIGTRDILALRLKAGTEVALVTRWWPGSSDIALLQRDPHLPPGQVVSQFREATGLSEDEVTQAGDNHR
jgi:hypothetical protein